MNGRSLRQGPPARAVAFVAFVGTVAELHGYHRGYHAFDAPGVALAVASCAPLLLRGRLDRLLVFALTMVPNALLSALGYPQALPIAPTLALIGAAADEHTRERLPMTAAVIGATLVLHVAAAAVGHSGFPGSSLLGATVAFGAAWIAGDGMRQRRDRIATYRERARVAERESQRERKLAAAEERTRIARDLHDSAAHAINVILVQAGAARLLRDRDPEGVTKALTTIEEVARETIGDIERMIRGLREDDAGVEPPAGLGALATLAARHRDAGAQVSLQIDGPARALNAALEQAAYRIVQESLTNAARHGRGGAEVSVAYAPLALELTITNPLPHGAPNGTGPPRGPGEGGHGILGMRERALLLGGSLWAGAAGAEFRVHAELPYDAPARR
jgi:signal transduction histidine kinase